MAAVATAAAGSVKRTSRTDMSSRTKSYVFSDARAAVTAPGARCLQEKTAASINIARSSTCTLTCRWHTEGAMASCFKRAGHLRASLQVCVHSPEDCFGSRPWLGARPIFQRHFLDLALALRIGQELVVLLGILATVALLSADSMKELIKDRSVRPLPRRRLPPRHLRPHIGQACDGRSRDRRSSEQCRAGRSRTPCCW